ncbi:MAG: hypothetical protein HGA76_04670 [Candidatus Firestonebacteria bacterium]|nr:hypothetical protein [Candidatus Firestonebacteria bacterium]
MTANRWGRGLLAITLVLAGLGAGCKSTYSKGAVSQAISDICEKEYGVRVGVQTGENTVSVFLPAANVLKNDMSFSDHVLDKIEHVMLTATRVTLSSEMKYDFFVLTTRDSRTGVEIAFVRYIKDIRRLITDDISRTDFFQRMLIEVKRVDPAAPPQFKNYRLQDFLASQLAERLRQDLSLNVVAGRLFHLVDLEGAYVVVPAPQRHLLPTAVFRITLLFHPDAPPFETMGTSALRDDFSRLFLHTAQIVTRRYDFRAFDGLELVDRTGRRLAYFDRKEFNRDSVSTLMELIRSLKDKTKE